MDQRVNLAQIRSIDGAQFRAFEELCYQLRDPTPAGAQLRKTGNPDGGYEWYLIMPDGSQEGWQAKYVTPPVNWTSLFSQMRQSLKRVAAERPSCRKLTFCISVDMPESLVAKEQSSAREKFEAQKAKWVQQIPGAKDIEIGLWSAGDVLERLANHPDSRGKTWFFFDQEVFSLTWLTEQRQIAEQSAGERYSAELHVELPVSFAVEGLALSDRFCERFAERRRAVAKLRPRLEKNFSGIGVTTEMKRLRSLFDAWLVQTPEQIERPTRPKRLDCATACEQLRDAIGAAFPEPPRRRTSESVAKRTPRQRELDVRREDLRHELWVLSNALGPFADLLESPAARAAEKGALLLSGDAGQGKTHLFCDAVSRALGAGQPAAVLLCNEFAGGQPWRDIGSQLGLGDPGWDVLRGAMAAAGEAAGRPFLLLLDALNEASKPRAWKNSLRRVLAQALASDWVCVGLSLRSTYREAVLPQGGLADIVAEVEHRGFQGRELEAIEHYFDTFGLTQPVVPLLNPEFANPLFLKLFCEGAKGTGRRDAASGADHVSEVFDRYLTWKSEQVNDTLELDPTLAPVRSAVEALAGEMAQRGGGVLSYVDAQALLDGLAPGCTKWPATMTGQLLATGILAKDLWWNPKTGTREDVIRFSYQRFSDYLVCESLISSFKDEAEFRQSVKAGQTLRATVLGAPAGWIEALSVLVPERFGIELLSAARWNLTPEQLRVWQRALIQSVITRRPACVTEATLKLLSKTRAPLAEIWQTYITVAAIPDHVLNADRLHARLLSHDLPTRDHGWTVPLRYAMEDEGPLARLGRWLCRGPHPDCPDGVLRLAAIPAIWALSSNVRLLRDYATKGLATSLAGRSGVLCELLEGFHEADDPYVIERLASVAHAALLLDRSDPAGSARVARAVYDLVLDGERPPDILATDAVRGCFEVCLASGAVSKEQYERVCPPYGAAAPNKPPSQAQLKRRYGSHMDEKTGQYKASPYSSIYHSLFDMGDFGRYVVGTAVDDFSNTPLDQPRPAKGSTSEFPTDLANRFIMERVVSLGWEPRLFETIDQGIGRHWGGDAKSPDRIGKKYQWIALRELLARISDNFHVRDRYVDWPDTYLGAWQLHQRDIDPTLPPAPRLRTDEEDELYEIHPTFVPDSACAWWLPAMPSYLASDQRPPDAWAADVSDVPSFRDLLERSDQQGRSWIALQGVFNADEARIDEEIDHSKRRRDLWLSLKSWLVPAASADRAYRVLGKHSIGGHWLQDAHAMTGAAYLAEMPWASAAFHPDDDWASYELRQTSLAKVALTPAWSEYCWEGSSRDGSIAHSINAHLPSSPLYQAGKLSWKPHSREWLDETGEGVAQYRESLGDRCSALLVCTDWLDATLAKLDCALVIGLHGEKTLYEGGWNPGIVGGWTQMDAVALRTDGAWKIGRRRDELRR